MTSLVQFVVDATTGLVLAVAGHRTPLLRGSRAAELRAARKARAQLTDDTLLPCGAQRRTR